MVDNSSLKDIESDLEAIEEQELQSYSEINMTSTFAIGGTHSDLTTFMNPSFKGFLRHLSFHLWLLTPLILLFIPPEPKFIDKIMQKLSKKDASVGEGTRSPAQERLIQDCNNMRGLTTSSTFGSKLGKLKLPLAITVVLLVSSTFGLLWALLHLNSGVTSSSIVCGIIFWSSVCVIISITKLTTILVQWVPTKFDPEIEALYNDLCAPFRLERSDFAKVLCCMRDIKTVKFGHDYVTEKMTPVDRLSLVIAGRLLVRQSGKLLHVVPRLQFVDSPEWFGVAADELFQISATALEETRVLVWHKDKLKLTLMENPYLYTIFEHIIARDVVRKLTQTHDGTCLDSLDKKSASEYEDFLSSRKLKSYAVSDASNLLQATTKNSYVRVNGSVHILNEQFIQPSTWTSLSRISEQDDEGVMSPL